MRGRAGLTQRAPASPARVLLVAKGLGPGGMERLLVNQVRFSDRRRWAYDVAYLVPEKDQLAGELRAAGARVWCLRARRAGGAPWPIRLRSLLGRVDVVHTHSPSMAPVVRVLARTSPGRPAVVYTEHNSWGPYRLPARLANRWTYGLDDAQLAVSEAAYESVPEARRGRLRVLTHGIDLEDVRRRSDRQAARRTLGIPQSQVLIGVVANLRPEKQLHLVLSAAARLVAERSDVRFVSIGQGPLAGELRALHRELGLGDRFQLLGYRPDAVELMSGFDVFTLASRWEGLPVAFMEARALGLPVVVTPVGGLESHVRPGVDGSFVPVGDESALVDAWRAVVVDTPLRTRLAAGSAEAAGAFDARGAVAAIEATYDRLLRPVTTPQPT